MSGPIALITGSSRGIGRAIARQLADDGMRVIVNYRENAAAAEETRAEIAARGGFAVVRQFDLADREQVTAAVQALTDELGVIDVLVNNAAIMREKPLLRVRDADWDATIATNLSGVHHCTQAVLKTWARHGYGRRIVNLTSIGGETGFIHSTSYAASKAGVIGFTKALAQELAPRGVTVNAVSPGLILTDGTREMKKEELAARIPLGRAGLPEEVAYLVSFLVSDRAGFITGQVIRINGGMYM